MHRYAYLVVNFIIIIIIICFFFIKQGIWTNFIIFFNVNLFISYLSQVKNFVCIWLHSCGFRESLAGEEGLWQEHEGHQLLAITVCILMDLQNYLFVLTEHKFVKYYLSPSANM